MNENRTKWICDHILFTWFHIGFNSTKMYIIIYITQYSDNKFARNSDKFVIRSLIVILLLSVLRIGCCFFLNISTLMLLVAYILKLVRKKTHVFCLWANLCSFVVVEFVEMIEPFNIDLRLPFLCAFSVCREDQRCAFYSDVYATKMDLLLLTFWFLVMCFFSRSW